MNSSSLPELERQALNILVDSSTIPHSKTNQNGLSAFAWAAWRGSITRHVPIASGIGFFRYAGSNKTFCRGIIDSLIQCRFVYEQSRPLIIVWGDCMPVLDRLLGNAPIVSLKKECYQVFKICEWYNEHGVQVRFGYMNEKHSDYRFIDRLSKDGRAFIESCIKKRTGW